MSTEPLQPCLTPENLHRAIQDLISGHPEEASRWLREVLVTMPELQDGPLRVRTASELEPVLRRLVQEAIARLPSVQRSSAPARSLGLFSAPENEAPLAPPKHHLGAPGYMSVPERVLGEAFELCIARDVHPLPSTNAREGYHGDRHLDYWLSGLEDYVRVRTAVERHGSRLQSPYGVLDFGCATGRVLRHFLSQAPGLELWGCDLNERHIDWLLAHMPPTLRPFQCLTLPHLPLEDRTLDLVTAFSVFTHIDEFELAWLLELRRILRPGGLAYITIHSDDTWARLRPGMAVYHHLLELAPLITDHAVTPALFERPMPRDKTVFRWTIQELNNTNVFLSKRHIQRAWGRFFDVLEIVPEGSGYQDVVILRKPS